MASRTGGHRHDRPAAHRAHLRQRIVLPHGRHVLTLARANPDLPLARTQGEQRRGLPFATVMSQRRRQLPQSVGDRTDQRCTPQQPGLRLGHVHVDRGGTGDVHQGLGQRAVDRVRVGLIEQRALDGALRVPIAAHARAAFNQCLMIPEARQFIGQPLRPVQQVLAEIGPRAGIHGERQLAAVASVGGSHDARAEAVPRSRVSPGREHRRVDRRRLGPVLARGDALRRVNDARSTPAAGSWWQRGYGRFPRRPDGGRNPERCAARSGFRRRSGRTASAAPGRPPAHHRIPVPSDRSSPLPVRRIPRPPPCVPGDVSSPHSHRCPIATADRRLLRRNRPMPMRHLPEASGLIDIPWWHLNERPASGPRLARHHTPGAGSACQTAARSGRGCRTSEDAWTESTRAHRHASG